ncbi:MAG: PKD domain-containing protein [Bacteroidetes bacterium]|nr:PKD domain-containing protein [Bacteroidota bacterium]
MKSSFLLLLGVLCIFISMQAQVINSCTPNSAVTGQVLTVSIMGQGTNFTSATNTSLRFGQNSINATAFNANSNTQITATFVIPPNTLLGNWDVVVDGNPNLVTLPAGFTIGIGSPNGNYGRVMGSIYRDDNVDCIKNVGEPGTAYRSVTITPGPFQTLTDANGNYSIWLPLGNYNLDYHPSFPSSSTCPTTGQRAISLTTNGQALFNEDFATEVFLYTDARVSLSGLPLRPGFSANSSVFVRNDGNTVIPNTLLKVIKPSFANFGSVFSQAPAYISGDTVAWNLPNISNPVQINYQLYCPPGVTIGTPYTLSASVTPSPMDYFTANNTFDNQRVVVGAWDPNDKRVFTPSGANADGDILQTDTILTYIVRFQNTGTDTAFNIYVRDTLDLPNLDMNGFRILGATHPYQVTMSPGGQLEFAFPNILLPDSGANQVGSNGALTYEVRPKAGLPLGTVIHNSASIYFDFNPPVKTNITQSRLCDVLNADFVTVPNGLTVQFNDLSTGTIQSYAWDFGDGNTSTLQNPIHTYANAGSYTACLVTNGICRSDTNCQNATLVAISEALPGFSISVIPNPMGQEATILVTNPGQNDAFELVLYNASGQQIRQLEGRMNTRLSLQREGLAQGLYLYRIRQGSHNIGAGHLLVAGE